MKSKIIRKSFRSRSWEVVIVLPTRILVKTSQLIHKIAILKKSMTLKNQRTTTLKYFIFDKISLKSKRNWLRNDKFLMKNRQIFMNNFFRKTQDSVNSLLSFNFLGRLMNQSKRIFNKLLKETQKKSKN